MRTPLPPFKRKAGFTLVEVAIAAVVAGVLATIGLYQMSQEMRYQMARSQVDQLKVLGTALAKYHGKYAINLLSGSDVAQVSDDWAPTVAELKTLYLLDGSFSATNLYSPTGGYSTTIRISPSGCTGTTCSLFGLAYLNTAVLDARGRPDSAAVGEALAYGGGSVGGSTAVDKANVRGYGSLWVEPSPLPAVAGILAVRSTGESSFVPLDGSTAMTGDLKMGTNDISEVGNFVATGNISGTNVQASNSVTANTVQSTGAVTGATVSATGLVSGANVQATGTVYANNVSATGTVAASGVSATNISASNVLSANSVTTNSMATTTATVSGGLNMSSGQTLSNNGRLHINASENIYLNPWSGGSTNVGGGGGSGQFNVLGNEYTAGNGNINDLYIRAAGKWASQMGGGMTPVASYGGCTAGQATWWTGWHKICVLSACGGRQPHCYMELQGSSGGNSYYKFDINGYGESMCGVATCYN